MLLYQGQTVSLLWQSKQARCAIWRACGLPHGGALAASPVLIRVLNLIPNPG